MGDRGDQDWELPQQAPSGLAWLCNGCGHRGIWNENWSWYGSLKELEDGDDLPTFCSDTCRPDAGGLALLRRRIKSDPDFVLNRSPIRRGSRSLSTFQDEP